MHLHLHLTYLTVVIKTKSKAAPRSNFKTKSNSDPKKAKSTPRDDGSALSLVRLGLAHPKCARRASAASVLPHTPRRSGKPTQPIDAFPAASANGRHRKSDMTNPANEHAPTSAQLTPTDVLLSLALAGYGDQSEIRPAFAQLSRETVAAILISATAGGFPQSEILETMLSSGVFSERTRAMAEQACSAAGSFLLMSVFAKVLSSLPS